MFYFENLNLCGLTSTLLNLQKEISDVQTNDVQVASIPLVK